MQRGDRGRKKVQGGGGGGSGGGRHADDRDKDYPPLILAHGHATPRHATAACPRPAPSLGSSSSGRRP